MNSLNPIVLWVACGAVILLSGGYLGWRFFGGGDKTVFLPGKTTHGHHQIEMACAACHEPWGGVKENSCIQCHGEELKRANDSHPKSKFQDPRNADRLVHIAADQCVTCHVEHRPEITHPMGVTQPADFCQHCHEDIGKERPSHAGFAFNTCATAGCHRFHDNTALYQDFLVKHAHEPDIKQDGRALLIAFLSGPKQPLKAADQNAPASATKEPSVVKSWAASAHARAAVNCRDCHGGGSSDATSWTDHPGQESCARCHAEENNGFQSGLHGMRLAQNLPAMQPALAEIPMKPEAAHRTLTCNSCHGAHDYDTRRAAVDSCLQCHNDPHTRAYLESPHARLWQAEMAGTAPAGSGVSCATCHLPRESHTVDGHTIVRVQHNQNDNLRPSEKMIRSVCLNCHGLSFSIDALADPALGANNFRTRPGRHIDSIEMALRRLTQKTPTAPPNSKQSKQ